jgi:iron complex outermembrane recepter protein
MGILRNRWARTVSAWSLLAAWIPVAHAADAPAAAAAAPDGTGGDVADITVTARHRTESAQQVPIGITALAGTQVAEQGAFNLKQIVQQLPSLNIQGYSGRNQTITIRGIGTNAGGTNDGLEQGVGLYVDGVYRPRTGSVITDLIDIDSIQVLRGPQGTLFGKNTVAGAVDITTPEPSFTPRVKVEGSYGNYNYARGYVSIDLPLSDTLAFHASYLHTRRDGLIYNTTYHQNWDVQDNDAARADLLWKPTSNFKLRVTGDYSSQKGEMGFQILAAVLPTTLANGAQVRGFYRRAADVGYDPIPVDPFARQTDINSSQYDHMQSWGVQARADLDLAGGQTITSITAFRRWFWLPNYDGDQFGADISPEGIVETHQSQFSQELRLTSATGHTIDYTGGLYFFWQTDNDYQLSSYGTAASVWLTTPNTPTASTASALPVAALNGLGAFSHVVPSTWSYAAYGQATWHVTPDVRLTGGLRYTLEHKTGSYDAYPVGDYAALSTFPTAQQATIAARRAAYAPTSSYDASNDTGNVSGTLIAAWDVARDVHTYASYSRGYKSPGINLVARSLGVNIFVLPEKVDDYEIGVKSRWWGGRAEFNVNLFWTIDHNYQANYINTNVSPNASYITNVGTVRTRGVEVDSRFTPLTGLSLSFSGSYDDATYLSYTNAPSPFLYSYLPSVDLSGKPASGQPKWDLSGAAEYVRPVGSAEVYGGGDLVWRSGFFAAVNDDPFSYVAGYAVAGLHVGVRWPLGRVGLGAQPDQHQLLQHQIGHRHVWRGLFDAGRSAPLRRDPAREVLTWPDAPCCAGRRVPRCCCWRPAAAPDTTKRPCVGPFSCPPRGIRSPAAPAPMSIRSAWPMPR